MIEGAVAALVLAAVIGIPLLMAFLAAIGALVSGVKALRKRP